MTEPILIYSDAFQVKSGSLPPVPLHLARESATDMATGFLDSKLRVPGLMIT